MSLLSVRPVSPAVNYETAGSLAKASFETAGSVAYQPGGETAGSVACSSSSSSGGSFNTIA